jgi:hypothetical protein
MAARHSTSFAILFEEPIFYTKKWHFFFETILTVNFCLESGSANVWGGGQDGGPVLHFFADSRHLLPQVVQERPGVLQVMC